MALITADPRAVKNLRLDIDGDRYEMHVNDVNWTKNDQRVTWQGGTSDATFTDNITSEHVCNITLVHDYQNEDSLYNVLIDREGELAVVSYRPDADGDFVVGATITLVAPALGSKVGAHGESTIACPSTKPVRTFTAPA